MKPHEYEQTWDVSDYKTFKERHPELLIDKSFFISQVFKSNKKVLLFTRNPRFGKTMNLTMFQTFIEEPS